MSERAAALLSDALKLSELERELLAGELLDSLDSDASDINSLSDEEFERELNRRHEEALRDPSVLVSLEEVKRIMAIE